MKKRIITRAFVWITLCCLFVSCKKNEVESPAPFLGITVFDFFKTHPDTFIFKSESTIPCAFTWDFGDGTAEVSGDSVSHIFDYGYYYVKMKGTTSAGVTATTIKGVNASPYVRAKITQLKFTRLPLLRSDGSPWTQNNNAIDIYCVAANGKNKAVSTTISSISVSDSIMYSFHFSPPMSVEYFDKPLFFKVFIKNISPIPDEQMEAVVLDKNVTELMTNKLPYTLNKNFETATSAGNFSFYWQ